MNISKVVVPIKVLDKCYPDGFIGFTKDVKDKVGILLDDKNVYIKSSSDFVKHTNLVDFWRNRGLQILKIVDGETYWNEICPFDENGEIPSYKCDWI